LLFGEQLKRIMGFVYTILTAIMLNLYAVADIPYAALETAFTTGDAAKIVAQGKDKMIINIADKEGVYSQSQASQVLKNFFTQNPGATFRFTFKGKETEEGAFAIGTYTAKSGAFRVTVKWKKLGADYRIESVGIEKS
jgi:hypothetical protein